MSTKMNPAKKHTQAGRRKSGRKHRYTHNGRHNSTPEAGNYGRSGKRKRGATT